MTTRRRHSRTKPRDHEHADRRAALDVLLARAQRGRLSAAEARLLCEYVGQERRSADESRKANEGTTRTLARHRAAADAVVRELEGDVAEARQRAADAEEQLIAYRAVFGPGALDRYRIARQQVAAVRALLPTTPRPRLGLPNGLAYINGRHDAYDAVRDALAQH
ncbi:hypothetical protein [Streptomyces sp. MBT53]|uniref:hypothetical protein n=1 Tax=Streptomyces sp. MBT53 TaxID=1488384 RepID=UPI0019136B6C|nr:hypothetical protein [Streptomyces sp. MBT53]MBK6015602.1 hypothetical protein [Streptomyces sp. MBT53]